MILSPKRGESQSKGQSANIQGNQKSQPYVKNKKQAWKVKQIAQTLETGNIKNTLRMIKTQHPNEFQSFIAQTVDKECTALLDYDNSKPLRNNSPQELWDFKLTDILQAFQTHTPFCWKIMCKMASERHRSYEYIESYVLTAFLILMKSRSQNVNAFQMANALAMYKFDITREGFDYLSSLGICVAHSTLHNKLKEVEGKIAAESLAEMKAGLETNSVSSASFDK